MTYARDEDNTQKPKPKPEDYGWHESRGFDDEPSGWMFECSEEAYLEALEKWKEGVRRVADIFELLGIAS